jgi:F0F1-type ATP synthase gamma subunit
MRRAAVWPCAWRVHILMCALSSDQGLCGGLNTRVSKEVKLALDAADDERKPTVSAPRGA